MVTEHMIKNTLRRLARQRVALYYQRGDVWVIENAVSESESIDIASALRTCQLRGWVTPEKNPMIRYDVDPEGNFPKDPSGITTVYRLTEAGWSVINRSHVWVISTFVVAAASLIATFLSVYLTLHGWH
jgi:hypothetical protein